MGLKVIGTEIFWNGKKVVTADEVTAGTTVLIPKGAVPVPAYIDMRAIPTAWASYNGLTGVINDSYNISNIVKTATGKYTVTIDGLDNANYAIQVTATDANNFNRAGTAKAVNSTTLEVGTFGTNNDVLMDLPDIYITVMGGKN